MNGGMLIDILGHFTHGKAHVSIEFVPYLYRKPMIVAYRCIEAHILWSFHVEQLWK